MTIPEPLRCYRLDDGGGCDDLALYCEAGGIVSYPNFRRRLDTASRVTPFRDGDAGNHTALAMQQYATLFRASVAVAGSD
jgi:hypothetical protein